MSIKKKEVHTRLEALPGEELTAQYANYFHVQLDDLVRIAFLERVGGGSEKRYPRAVVAINRDNAIDLANLILELIEGEKL